MADYRNFHSSILKFCKDFGQTNGLSIIDFEAHANINELPDAHLLGPGEFEITNDDGLYYITTTLGVSTFNDTNLGKLRSVIDRLFAEIKPGRTLDWYYADDASKGGKMTITSPVSVMPVVRQAQNRPLQFIGISLVTDVDGR